MPQELKLKIFCCYGIYGIANRQILMIIPESYQSIMPCHVLKPRATVNVFTAVGEVKVLPFCYFMLIYFVALQELNSSVSDIVEGILKMHDTTKVRHNQGDRMFIDVAVRKLIL